MYSLMSCLFVGTFFFFFCCRLCCFCFFSVSQDKDFKKEMDKLMESDEWKNGATDATNFLNDPKAMEAMAKKVHCMDTTGMERYFHVSYHRLCPSLSSFVCFLFSACALFFIFLV